MLEEFKIIGDNNTEKQPTKKTRSTKKTEPEDYNFNIDTMFNNQTWSTTLEEHRKNKTENKPLNNSFTLDEIDNNSKDLKNTNLSNQDEKQNDPINEQEIKETREDLANLVILLFDMGINQSIKIFTKYEVKENENDNAKKRKQLERVCVKIFDKYDFQPNIWTEFLAVLSVYGLQKYQSLENQEKNKKVISSETKQKTINKLKNIQTEPEPEPEKETELKNNKITSIAELL